MWESLVVYVNQCVPPVAVIASFPIERQQLA